MKRAAAAVGMALALVGRVHAKPPVARTPSRATAPPVRVVVPPAAPLPMLPSIARVRIETASTHVLVVEEVSLPRGEWQSGGLNFYVAYGAPGTPLALDVRLVSVPRGAPESRLEDAGEALVVEPEVRRDPSAQLLLGRPQMSGVFIRATEAQLRRVYATSDTAALRIRSVLAPPASSQNGARDVVVRLGIAGALPLTLGRIQLVSHDPHAQIARAEASLCGPEADPFPLAIAVVPKPTGLPEPAASTVPPAMAVRHASDDLCIRWWAEPAR